MTIGLPPVVLRAIERLEQHGHRAYAVGGCVRDSLIGRIPNDWDITTSARPEETAAAFSDFRTVETGVKHGTLTVIIDGIPLEITTFRNDGEYADNRHPIAVTFSDTPEDDLSRRDFTVNAMAYHPVEGLLDLFGGQHDLQARKIVCVGDPKRRFDEDGLRILRAIRFASVLDFTIDENTSKAVHAQKALLANIAAERIREEFCKLLMGAGAVRILREYSDVIAVFIPEIVPCIGFSQNTKYHCYDIYEHALQALSHCSGDLITRLALYLHDIGKPCVYTEDETGGHFKGHGKVGVELTERVLQRLRFDNTTRDTVMRLVEYHDRDIPAEERAVKRLMCKMSDADIFRLMEIKRCDRLAHAAPFNELGSAVVEIPNLVRAIRASDACLSLRSLAIKGNDLMQIGIPAGKEIGRILTAVLDCVINGELPNEKQALLAYVKTTFLTDRT